MFAKKWLLYFRKLSFWQQWLRVAETTNNAATLAPRKIYIIPTRWGVLYGVMLIALLVGAINYAVSLGYFVTFLLASLGNIAMLHTWRNIVHLQVSLLHTKPVFAGDTAIVVAQVSDSKNRMRHAIAMHFVDNAITKEDVSPNTSQTFNLQLATFERGYLLSPRISLYTQFPLSLFHAWAYVDHSFQVLIYAQPIDSKLNPALSADANAEGANHFSKGDDDFNGHKSYQVGDAFNRVDWKASSRGIGMFTKQYSGNGQSTLWLNWESTLGLNHEARISQLSYWVVEAYRSQQTFGLRLPDSTLIPNNTEAHYHQALTALALM